MRVALVNLTSGGLSGGYQKYLERMLPLLKESPAVSRLEILSPEGLDVPGDSADRYWSWPSVDGITGHHALRSALVSSSPDVVFVPTARLVRTSQPSVVMVRNMEPLIAPFAGNSARDGLKNIARRLTARSSCHRATRVIAVSNFVRDFLVEHWNVRAEKVGVVPHGVEKTLPPDQWARGKTTTFPIDRPMVFTAGSIRPARGLEDLLGALSYLSEAGLKLRVVVAGAVSGDGRAYQQRMRRDVERAGHAEDVVWAGSLSQEEMAWCYANCSAFVMTSRVEACPNTALEALAYGSLCIATTNRPMPETFGDAALYYQAGDSGMLAETITAAFHMSPAERNGMEGRAVARAAQFTWDKTARETIEQLQLAAGKA